MPRKFHIYLSRPVVTTVLEETWGLAGEFTEKYDFSPVLLVLGLWVWGNLMGLAAFPRVLNKTSSLPNQASQRTLA